MDPRTSEIADAGPGTYDMMPGRCVVTIFENFAATTKTEELSTLDALAHRIRNTSKARKASLRWLKLARFGEHRTPKNSLRQDANVLAISGIEADYDDERMSFDDAHALLEQQGITSIIYTSPSRTAFRPRWRVLCPFLREMPPARRNHHMGRLNGLFRGVFAGESWTLSQSYYFGSVAANPSHRVEIVEGEPIDEHDDLDEVWLGKPAGAGQTDDGQAAGQDIREDAELIRCIVTGEHLHFELVALAARYAARDIPSRTICGLLQGMMLSQPKEARDARWQDRYYDIGRTVASARIKFKGNAEGERKAVTRLALTLVRRQRPENEIRWHVGHAAAAIGLTPEQADGIVVWARRAVAKDIANAA